MTNAQKAKAQQYFDSYPEASVIYETSDGQIFLDKNSGDAVNHQRRLSDVNKEARMETFYRKDLNRKTDEELEAERTDDQQEEEEEEEEVEEQEEEEEEEQEQPEIKTDLVVDGKEVIPADEETKKVVDEAHAAGETVVIPAEAIAIPAAETKPEEQTNQSRSNGRGSNRKKN